MRCVEIIGGMPLYDCSFDVELVSNIIFKLKRGKAVDLLAYQLNICNFVIPLYRYYC